MTKRTFLCSFGEEGQRISFYLEATNLAFDYQTSKKSVNVKVLYVSEAEQTVKISAVGECKLEIFGKSFALPSVYHCQRGSGELLSRVAIGVDDDLYPGAAIGILTLDYSCEGFAPLVGQFKVTCELAKMYRIPQLSTDKTVYRLGEAVKLSGEMLSEGFDITVSLVPESGIAYYYATVNDYACSLPSFLEWMNDYPFSRSFKADMHVSARFGDAVLPHEQIIPLEFYLSVNDGTPEATVETEYVSEYPALDSLPYGVKNRSSLDIRVKDIVCKLGATVEKCYVTYKGVNYSVRELNTGLLTDTAGRVYGVHIIDSRGFVFDRYVYTDVREYGVPEFSASVCRVDEYGNESRGGSGISIAPSITRSFPLDGRNVYKLYFTCETADGEVIKDKTEVADGGVYIAELGLDGLASYNVKVWCEDSLGSVSSCKYLLEANRVELNIAKNRIAVGKYAEEEMLLDSAWPIRSDGDVSFTDPEGNTVSLATAFGGGKLAVTGESYTVSSADALATALEREHDGMSIAVINVKGSGLAFTKGVHTVFKYRIGELAGYREI